MEKVNVKSKFKLFSETWCPKIVGELNDSYVKLAKFQGEFVWHSHATEDELFYVVSGKLDIHFRDKIINLEEGEFCIVPKGIEHKPVAMEGAHVMLLEPKTVLNTGDADSKKAVHDLEWI